MFSKPTNPPKPPTTPAPSGPTTTTTPMTSAAPTPAPSPSAAPTPAPAPATPADLAAKKGPRVASLIANDMTFEGSLSGDGELQVDGIIRGDVRVARMSVGETGHVEGGIYSETAEIRGRVIGSITAKQVRLYGQCYVDGDITHEQLAIESGAFFQGRSLKFQRPPATAAAQPSAAKPAAAPPAADRSVAPATGNAVGQSAPSVNGDATTAAPPN
jgi:cytoskeletal protein CcmA (bactofilin family)